MSLNAEPPAGNNLGHRAVARRRAGGCSPLGRPPAPRGPLTPPSALPVLGLAAPSSCPARVAGPAPAGTVSAAPRPRGGAQMTRPELSRPDDGDPLELIDPDELCA